VLRAALGQDGIEPLGSRLRTLGPLPFAGAVALHFASVALGTWRWRLLLRARGVRLPGAFLLRSYLVGRFAAAFTPSTAGLDVVRALHVGRAIGDLPASTAVIATEKAIGVLGLALVGAGLAAAGADVLPRGPALLAAACAAAAATAGLALLARPSLLAPLTRALPGPLRTRAGALLHALPSGGLEARTLGRALALGLLGHLAVSAAFAAAGLALGVHASGAALLTVGNALVISQLLPISVSGAGVREGVAVVLLARLGVPAADAALVSLLGYLAGQGPALAGGLLATLPAPAARAAVTGSAFPGAVVTKS
jgi:uncharacterized membrane protein YbhN (UPF0104 family)